MQASPPLRAGSDSRAASPPIHKKSIQIKYKSFQPGTASAEGQEPACAKSVPPAAAGALCHTRFKSPALGSFPRAPGEMLCCRTQRARLSKHRDVLDEVCRALRAAKLFSALQDEPFITCSCLISCSLAANLLKGCFL